MDLQNVSIHFKKHKYKRKLDLRSKPTLCFLFQQIKVKKDELEVFRPGRVGRLQKVLWDLFEKPHTSIGARVCYLFIYHQPAHTIESDVTCSRL